MRRRKTIINVKQKHDPAGPRLEGTITLGKNSSAWQGNFLFFPEAT